MKLSQTRILTLNNSFGESQEDFIHKISKFNKISSMLISETTKIADFK